VERVVITGSTEYTSGIYKAGASLPDSRLESSCTQRVVVGRATLVRFPDGWHIVTAHMSLIHA
jgi:hypothetical protein